MDSDDWIEPQTLEKALEAGLREEADLVVFGYRSVDEAGRTLQTFLEEAPKDRALSLEQQPDLLLASPSACIRLYRRELLARTGILFRPGCGMRTCAPRPSCWPSPSKWCFWTL
mgnify:FL=1